MSLFSEVRSRARHVVGPVLAICAVAYFAYHAVQGDRGLIALWHLSQRIEVARVQLGETSRQRSVLAHRVKLLNRSSLDPDMLDERARVMLNYGHPNETVIFRRPTPERR
jgi:cell division protein FtsB